MQKEECLKGSTEVNACEKMYRRKHGRKSVKQEEEREELQEDTLLGKRKYIRKNVLKKNSTGTVVQKEGRKCRKGEYRTKYLWEKGDVL